MTPSSPDQRPTETPAAAPPAARATRRKKPVQPAAAQATVAPQAAVAKPAKAGKKALPVKVAKTVSAVPPATASKPAAAAKARAVVPAAATPPQAAAKPLKSNAKLVRDSFTMPQADYDLISILKTRAVALRRPAKKSELLRAGLHSLQALADAQLLAALEALMPIKAGRPKQSG
jgi:hypothetical protein